MNFVNAVLSHGLYVGVVAVLIVCGLGLPVPEEGVFLAAGWYGASHDATVWMLCVCGVVGILLGDSIPYWAGRKYGVGVLKCRPFSWFVKEKGIDQTRAFFGRHGSKAIFCGRFVAGLRMPTFFMAGCMGVKYPAFVLWDLLGALISCPVSIWLAYTYGERAEKMLSESKPFLFGAIALVVLYTIYHVWSHRPGKGNSSKNDSAAAASPKPPSPPAVPRAADLETTPHP
ncbi:MAG TPA: DedA family protein [Planctomycetota bacterium]|nr:DedA family protein [Planctomycetota bacterium]